MAERTQIAARTTPLRGSSVVTGVERVVAVETWLLAAAPCVNQARWEWREGGVAFLRCGGLFTALRVPAVVVCAAVGSSDPDAVSACLAEELEEGPVIASHGSTHYYVLLPVSAARRTPVPGAEYLAPRSLLGVPPLAAACPQGSGSYWVVPMSTPAELCHAGLVARLVARGRARLDGGEPR